MKTKILSVFAAALGLVLAGCTGMSQSQVISANVQGTGSAVGTNLLRAHSVNGVVDPAYLASYENLIPKVAGTMNGLLTPADQHTILAGQSGSITLSKDQLTVVAYLSGLSPEFIAVNGGPVKTADGALADALCQQFAAGMANAVGLVTGANYVVPALSSPSNAAVSPTH